MGGCAKEEDSLSTTQVINSLGDFKPLVEQASVENLLRNLVLLLRQHPDWGVQVSDTEAWEETTLSVLTRPQSWLCWASGLLTMMWDFVLSVAGWIFAGLVFLSTLWAGFVLYRRTVLRREREKREAFALVEQATDILFRQHQMVGREGKGGHSFLAIDHIRDQLIPPQERNPKFFAKLTPSTCSSMVECIFHRQQPWLDNVFSPNYKLLTVEFKCNMFPWIKNEPFSQ